MRKTLKRAGKQLDDLEALVFRERTALAVSRSRVEFGMLAHHSHSSLGEAYANAIVSALRTLKHASTLTKTPSGDALTSDRTNFRIRLTAAYNPTEDPGLVKGKVWCPVTGRMIMPHAIKAAHIIPHHVGEIQASYLLGKPPEEGYKTLWDVQNGLMLHTVVEAALDDAQLVIVAGEKESTFKCVVLDDESLSKHIEDDLTFRDLDGKQLEFRTEARPGKRNLYLNCVLTILRRRRYNVSGWEKDVERTLSGSVWATPGEWMRRSVIKALAQEVGDGTADAVMLRKENGVTEDLPGERGLEYAEKIALCLRGGFEGIEEGGGDDDEEDE